MILYSKGQAGRFLNRLLDLNQKGNRLLSIDHTMVVDGVSRSFRLRVPRSYDAARPAPLVMAFHVALTEKRSLVVSDWPPTTLSTTYALDQILRPSSCQKLFDADTTKPAVTKCTVRACELW